ncbi:MAG TPA: FAD-binding domain [Pseudolabrys sp.]|nr:FAD-binding domain [Pseudolabrys sp.]
MAVAKSVLISGAGIAGPTLAFWLKAAGFSPTLIERAPALRGGGYVIDFWGLGYDIAERMGLEANIQRTGYRVRELRVVNDRGRRVAGFGTGVFTSLTGGRYVTLARSGLSRLIFDRAGNDSETLFDEEIVALDERDDHVAVRLQRGGERRFDLVIGADGLHSAVRRLAFGPQQQFEKHLGYVVAAFEAEGYRHRDEDIYVMYCAPGRMVGRVTLRENRTLFLFVFAQELGNQLPDLAAQKALLHAHYDDGGWECPQILAALDRIGELYFDRVSQIRMPRWSKGRVALVGDAAYCVSLLAGQGSALAMVGAYVLAGELAKAQGDHASAFRNYENILRANIDGKQKGAERFATAFAPKTRWGLWFRNQVLNIAALPGLARLMLGRDIVETLELPEYDWPPR